MGAQEFENEDYVRSRWSLFMLLQLLFLNIPATGSATSWGGNQVMYDVRSFTVTELSLLRKKHDPEGACRSTVYEYQGVTNVLDLDQLFTNSAQPSSRQGSTSSALTAEKAVFRIVHVAEYDDTLYLRTMAMQAESMSQEVEKELQAMPVMEQATQPTDKDDDDDSDTIQGRNFKTPEVSWAEFSRPTRKKSRLNLKNLITGKFKTGRLENPPLKTTPCRSAAAGSAPKSKTPRSPKNSVRAGSRPTKSPKSPASGKLRRRTPQTSGRLAVDQGSYSLSVSKSRSVGRSSSRRVDPRATTEYLLTHCVSHSPQPEAVSRCSHTRIR